jgi:hypothetical protein
MTLNKEYRNYFVLLEVRIKEEFLNVNTCLQKQDLGFSRMTELSVLIS